MCGWVGACVRACVCVLYYIYISLKFVSSKTRLVNKPSKLGDVATTNSPEAGQVSGTSTGNCNGAHNLR